MKTLLVAVLAVVSVGAFAGDGDGGGGRDDERYNSGFGPAWFDTACGLPCFQVYRLEGNGTYIDPRKIGAAKTPADMRRLIAEVGGK